jgi:tripartite-type tricarboxylate transporter receptor subunit TctC
MRIIALRQVAAACALAASCAGAAAQGYPSKAIRLIVPFPPGSTPDIVGRTLGTKMSESWRQPVVVENRSGAGGNIGTAEAARAAPDGHTLVIGINGPIAVNKALYDKLPYDPDKDLAPISLLASGAQLLAVHPSVPANDLKEFVRHVRSNPGRLSYGSVGSGSASHLTMEILKSQAKLFIVHIPYRGFPPVVSDLLSGQIHAAFAIVPAVLPQVKAGRLKALAVTSARRNALAPDIATVAEQGFPQFDATAWIGLLAPAGTPQDVVDKLAAEASRILRLPEVHESLAKQGFDVIGSSPREFAAFIRAESEKWGAVVRAVGAKPE